MIQSTGNRELLHYASDIGIYSLVVGQILSVLPVIKYRARSQRVNYGSMTYRTVTG